MDIQFEPRDHATVVAISGSIDGMTAEALQSRLQERVKSGETRLVGDLGGVEYTSSAGLRTLLATVKEARRLGGDFRLAAVTPNVLRVLQLSGFTSILKIFDDVETAVASFAP